MPELRWHTAPAQPRAVVLFVHGGSETDPRRPRWTNLAVLRLWPFAWRLAGAHGRRVAVGRLKLSRRGWQGAEATPVQDLRWALDAASARWPQAPVVVVGHSLGGRAALAVADDPRVCQVLALAPWIVPTDPEPTAPGLRLLIAHAPGDRVTSASLAADLAARLRGRGLHASFVAIARGDHTMVRRARVWYAVALGEIEHGADLPRSSSGGWRAALVSRVAGIPRIGKVTRALDALDREPGEAGV